MPGLRPGADRCTYIHRASINKLPDESYEELFMECNIMAGVFFMAPALCFSAVKGKFMRYTEELA